MERGPEHWLERWHNPIVGIRQERDVHLLRHEAKQESIEARDSAAVPKDALPEHFAHFQAKPIVRILHECRRAARCLSLRDEVRLTHRQTAIDPGGCGHSRQAHRREDFPAIERPLPRKMWAKLGRRCEHETEGPPVTILLANSRLSR